MISVIFLNYNRREDLHRSLSSIFEQVGVEFEILVVDQNSSDGSVDMIANNFPKVKLFALKENLGVAGGRNFGAKQAKGDYLVFIDDDAEFIENNALKKVDFVFNCNPTINIIAFNVNGHPERPEKYLFFSKEKDYFTNKYIGCGHAIRNSVFVKLGGYTESLFFWGEEIEFAVKTFSIPNNKILYKGDIVLFHRVSQVSRLKWKDGRFFYKVRNRLLIMKTLFPFPINAIYLIYYSLAYSIRALQMNQVSSYHNGIREVRNVVLKNSVKLNFKMSIRYIFS